MSRLKRAAFAAVLTALVLGAIEVLAFLAFPAITGEPFSYAELAEEQRSLSGRAQVPLETRNGQGAPEIEGARRSEARLHPYLGYVWGAQTGLENIAERFDIEGLEVTPYGFIDNKPAVQKRSPDRVIVGILGGSVAMDLGQRGYQTLERILSEIPELAGRDFVFVRLAMSGYKQPQQLMTIAYLLSVGAEFDVLINLDGFNEVAIHGPENARFGTPPSYPRRWFPTTSPVPDSQTRHLLGAIDFQEEQRRKRAEAIQASPLRRSVLRNLYWKILDRRAAARIRADQEALVDLEARGTDSATAPNFEELGFYEQLVDIWERSSLQLFHLSTANGIRYFHFLQPNQYVEGSKPLTEKERRRAFRLDHEFRPGVVDGYPLLAAAGQRLRARGVSFYDLTDIFLQDEETLYIDACCHLNRTGNELMAGAIATRIAEELGTKRSDGAAAGKEHE